MMHVLIIFVFYTSLVATPPIGAELVTTQTRYVTPPTMVAAEFSSLAACEAAAAKTLAELRARAAPLIVTAGYTCNKKARSRPAPMTRR